MVAPQFLRSVVLARLLLPFVAIRLIARVLVAVGQA